VIDAWMRVGLVGLDLHLVEIESRIGVASLETYLTYAEPLAGHDPHQHRVRLS
jgi:hypothetical protein